ncbi:MULTISPECIES: GNAT family protein [unclassified Acinetobacter]|uniref:GNAT family N-acetyltransferase n=1 Tax=unclassified Acinetobacter TaxID=196816 RepID=UPI001D0EE029|nr:MULTISPECIES: GNAT family protein [unclassified Acinetobacter]
MMQFKIENDQIVLQIIQTSDAHDLFSAIQNTLTELRKFPASLVWALEEPNLQASKAFCQSRLIALLNQENFVFIIRLNTSNDFLGVMDIHNIDWQLNTASIGFWGNAKFKQKGYMTQALRLFIHTLFSKWNFVVLNAYVDAENLPARRLCEKNGFLLKNIEYDSVKNPVDGSFRDICHYRIER